VIRPPKVPEVVKRKSSGDEVWGSSGKDARYLSKLRRLLGKTDQQGRDLLLFTLQKMAR
jgi:hypothetical protein